VSLRYLLDSERVEYDDLLRHPRGTGDDARLAHLRTIASLRRALAAGPAEMRATHPRSAEWVESIQRRAMEEDKP